MAENIISGCLTPFVRKSFAFNHNDNRVMPDKNDRIQR